MSSSNDYSKRKITVITKRGCHICENVIEDLRRLSSKYAFELEMLDILEDRSLFDKYWIKIPVVRVNGKDVLEVEEIAFPDDRKKKLESLVSSLC